MEPHILKRLRDTDVPLHWEYPPGFDYAAELARVDTLRPDLEPLVGHVLELDRNVQDAAFFTELAFRAPPRPAPVGQVILTYVAIRFSSFGGLVTIWGNVPESPLSDDLTGALARVLESRGYHYIPASALDEPYEGHHQHAAEIRSWWLRFFDYC